MEVSIDAHRGDLVVLPTNEMSTDETISELQQSINEGASNFDCSNIAGPSTSFRLHNFVCGSPPPNFERSIQTTGLGIEDFGHPSSSLEPVPQSEDEVDQKPAIKFEDGIDRKPIVSTLDHKPFPLNFDHAPFVELKPDIRELNGDQATTTLPIRTYTNPPKIPGLNKMVAKFSYRGLDSDYDINVVYMDLINHRGIAADDEDFRLFCATFGLLDHDWNSGPSIDDRIKQGYWPAQVYCDHMPTSVLVFCLSDQELCERITSERPPLSAPRVDSTSIEQPETFRRSERFFHPTRRVHYNSGHDSDSD